MSARAGGFVELLSLLGYRADDPVVVSHKAPRGVFRSEWSTATLAPEVADSYAGEDVWFGVNPVARTRPGRGTAKDVTRLAAVFADLDVKPGAMATTASAVAVVAELSTMLGTPPVAVVDSGHGLHPYWAVDPDDPFVTLTEDNRGDAVALLRQFGRLVAHVAGLHGGCVDSVFDLARILRVPGTVNYKCPQAQALRVTMSVAPGYALTVKEIQERLTEFGVGELPGDRDTLGAATAPVGEWTWADRTHPAVTAAVASYASQTPHTRHPWLLGAATSLALAHRLGMVTEADHLNARTVVTDRFAWLLANHGLPRQAARGEVTDCWAFGGAMAERMTEATALADWQYWTDTVAPALTFNGNAAATPMADDTEAGFWHSRDELARIYSFARARRAAPWAVLGAVLVRVIVATPPHYVLPAFVGTEASLNLFVGLVGAPGSGKGASEAVAADAINVGQITTASVGSGEGIAHLFMSRPRKVLTQHETAVLFSITEIDSLTALTERRGATLLPELRNAFRQVIWPHRSS